MRGDIKNIAWWRTLPHPTKGLLVSFSDGELPSSQAAKIKQHLDRCAFCRASVEELHEGLALFARSASSVGPGGSLDAGLQRLASAIEKHGQANDLLLSNEQNTSALYANLSSELSIYLGARAAKQLLDGCRSSLSQRERLREAVAPVIIGFLGQNTGAAVLANVLRISDQSREVAS